MQACVPLDPLDDLPPDAVIAVAMSGGVDSSVAALRCAQRGFDTLGITLAMWSGSSEQVRDRGCCSVDSVDDARRVCATLGIPHYVWNLEAEFEDAVITDFESEYVNGRTPNPCVRCNERIKFGVLLQRALEAGATHVATGHYAQRGRLRDVATGTDSQEWTLHRARDANKDQSYTLHRLSQDQLAKAVFPLGAVDDKLAVRQLASEHGLVTAAKPDSQELCFVATTVSDDLRQRLAGRFQPGDIVTSDGEVVGQHRGIPFYTVGQRSRLDLAPKSADSAAAYVIAVRASTNTLVVGPREFLEETEVVADDASWVGGAPPAVGSRVGAQIRAHGKPHAAQVRAARGQRLELVLEDPVLHRSPGQPVVVYTGDRVLGGAIIAGDV